MQRTKHQNNPQIELLAIEAFKSSGFLIVNKTLIKHLGLLPAILLSNYIDKHIYFKEKTKSNDGWFYLTHEQQIDQLNIKEHSIKQSKNLLKKYGILEVKTKGIPSKEWMHINFNKLIDFLQLRGTGLAPSKSEGLDPEMSPGYIRRPNKGDRNIEYLPLAQYLSRIICTQKNMKHTSIQIKSWTNDIRQLIEDNSITQERIKNALNWYEKNIGGQFIPVIESGRSLRDKFAKLEAAILRGNSKSNGKPEKIMEYGEWWYLDKERGKYYNSVGRLYM